MPVIKLFKTIGNLNLKRWQWFLVIWTASLLVSYAVAQIFKLSVLALL